MFVSRMAVAIPISVSNPEVIRIAVCTVLFGISRTITSDK